jgi:hypothetical protein
MPEKVKAQPGKRQSVLQLILDRAEPVEWKPSSKNNLTRL